MNDPELLHGREDIALLDSRLQDVLASVSNEEAGELWKTLKEAKKDYLKANDDEIADALNQILWLIDQGYTEYQSWTEIRSILQERKKLVESERKRLIDMQQMITAERAMLLLGAVYDSIRRNVSDKSILAAITQDIRRLASLEPGGPTRPATAGEDPT